MATFPSSGSSVPARMRSNVDFPEPFGPINPIRLLSETVKDTFWKRGCDPKAFEIFCALMIGGNGGGLREISSSRLSVNYRLARALARLDESPWPDPSMIRKRTQDSFPRVSLTWVARGPFDIVCRSTRPQL